MRNRSDRRKERGAAALELSLATPALLMVLFGVIEFGRAFVIRENLVTAAHEAARVATQSSCPRPTEAEVVAAAQKTLAGSTLLNPEDVQIYLTNTGGESGTEATVEISYGAEFPVLSRFLDMPWLDSGTGQIVVEVVAENE